MLSQIPGKRSDSKLHRLEEKRKLRETSKNVSMGLEMIQSKINTYACLYLCTHTYIDTVLHFFGCFFIFLDLRFEVFILISSTVLNICFYY